MPGRTTLRLPPAPPGLTLHPRLRSPANRRPTRSPPPTSSPSPSTSTSRNTQPRTLENQALRPPSRPATPAEWAAHRAALRERFPEGWNPPKKISREAMAALRLFNAENPDTFSVPMLAEKFKISPEAVRRILRSSWEPSPEREMRMRRREWEDERVQEKEREKRREVWREERERRRALVAAGRAVRALGGSVVRAPEQAEQGGEEEGDVEVVTEEERKGRKGRRKVKVTLEDRLRAARLRAAQEALEEAEKAVQPSAPSPERGAKQSAIMGSSTTTRPASSASSTSSPTPSTAAPRPETYGTRRLPVSAHIPDLSAPLRTLLSTRSATSEEEGEDVEPLDENMRELREAYEKRMDQRFPLLGVGRVRMSWEEWVERRESRAAGRGREGQGRRRDEGGVEGRGREARERRAARLSPYVEEEQPPEERRADSTLTESSPPQSKSDPSPSPSPSPAPSPAPRHSPPSTHQPSPSPSPSPSISGRSSTREETGSQSQPLTGAARARALIQQRQVEALERRKARDEQVRSAERILGARMGRIRGSLSASG